MNFQGLTFKRAAAGAAFLVGLTLQALPAAAADAQQVLDRVYTYNAGAVLNMAFGNASRPPDFTKLGVSANGISTCTLTSVDGLWCLDGQNLKKWANPLALAPVGNTILNCTDAVLGFDATVTPSCTGMTVDESGGIWLAGKKRLPNNWPARPWWIPEATWIALQTWFSPYSLVKVVAKTNGACPAGSGWQAIAGRPYCAKEMYSGRFLVTQLSPAESGGQSGVVGIEDFRNILFFPDNSAAPQPVTLSGGWNTGLKFGEVLDDVTVLKHAGQSFVIATTNSGRVLAKNAASVTPPFQVFNIPADRAPGLAKCSNAGKFGVRASPTADIVFVTDRAYCQALALVPNASNFASLVHLKWTRQGANGPITSDLTLSTRDQGIGTFPVIGLTVAPGTGFDFADCGVGETCGIVNGPDGKPAAKLYDVQLAPGSPSSATVFQVKNLPDCRYAFMEGFTQRALCASKVGVVVNPGGGFATIDANTGASTPWFPPSAQVLNVTPLLPLDVTSNFDDSGVPPLGLPPLLISPRYRAQSRNHFLFDAIFIKPAPGAQFQGVLGAEYDVPALEGGAPGSSLGCPIVPPDAPPLDPSVPHGTPSIADLLKWDVITAVSETWISVPSVTPQKSFIDSLANVGCGSVKGSYGRLSLLPYNMEIAPDTYGPTQASNTPVLTTGNDAVFLRLADSLINDLTYVYFELACKAVDNPAGGAPLSDYYCNPANATPPQHFGPYPIDELFWIREKFNRCMVGAFDSLEHDQSLLITPVSGDYRNRPYCIAFLERLDSFVATLPATSPLNDKANRVGELKARVNILRNLHKTKVLPSIPDSGFQSEPPPSN
jgi:hypothetical protein